MFLIERVIGFSTYMLILMIVCGLFTKTNARSKSIFKFYIVCLCIMAFLYKPYITADLYRIYDEVLFYSDMEFQYFWTNFALESAIPIARTLYWITGQTGINELLPTFSAFACYSFIFYIFRKTEEIFGISRKNMATVLFFVMTTSIYISVIGGIRMMLALSMIAFSFFRGTVEKKMGVFDILLYVAAIFTHAMSVVVIGIYLASILFFSKRQVLKKVVLIMVVVVAGAAAVITSYFGSFITRVVEKALYYISGDGYSDPWEYLMGTLIILLLTLMYMEYRRLPGKTELNLRLKPYNVTTMVCMLIALLFCFEFSIFYRFGGQLAVILAIPAMMITLENAKGRPSRLMKSMDFNSVMILLSLCIALISCTRGSLSALKFFEL